MGNGFIVVCKDNWKKASPEEREEMTYQTLENIHNRLTAIENKSVLNMAYSWTGGLIGGGLAALGLKWWG